jgi:hypothetical protein
LIKYEEGDHFNEFHYDTRKNKEIATVLIYPPYNTFTGGDLVFKINDKLFALNTSSFSKTEFTIVIFTDILHKCEPITSGTRYVFKTSIISSMPKILSDDLKFTLEKLEKYNPDKQNKQDKTEKIAEIKKQLKNVIDTYYDSKKKYINEFLPDDINDDDPDDYSDSEITYKKLLQQLSSLESQKITYQYTFFEQVYNLIDNKHNINILPTYIENIYDINSYESYIVEYVKSLLQKGYNVAPLYMKFYFKTEFKDYENMTGSSPIDINMIDGGFYTGYLTKYNINYQITWIKNGEQIEYYSQYNDESGDDIFEAYECSCLMIWK